MENVYQDFFTKFLCLRQPFWLEIRILYLKNHHWLFEYAQTLEDIESICKKYDTPNYIIYYSTGLRLEKERKEKSITERTFFYFDVEAEHDKPPLSDSKYNNKLMETIVYISSEMERLFNLTPNVIYVSGRGYHLGYAHKPLNVENYDLKFRMWYKWIKKTLSEGNKDLKIPGKPHSDIKFNDNIQNKGRLGGCPGTINYKYPEKPKREIIKINTEITNNLEPILDKFELPVFKHDSEVISKGVKRLWNEKTIFNAPEFQVFKCDIPANRGYEIHNKLLFALKLLMDKYDIKNREEVGRAFEALGYWYEDMCPVEDKSYHYSPSILNNWVMTHWEFCLEHNFKLPYPILYSKSYGFIPRIGNYVDSRNIDLKTPMDIINYVKAWNNKTMKKQGDLEVYFIEEMKVSVMSKLSNPKLKEWVIQNNFLDKVKLVK